MVCEWGWEECGAWRVSGGGRVRGMACEWGWEECGAWRVSGWEGCVSEGGRGVGQVVFKETSCICDMYTCTCVEIVNCTCLSPSLRLVRCSSTSLRDTNSIPRPLYW